MSARQLARVLSFVVALILMGGCSWDSSLSRFVRKDDDAFARAYFDSVRTGRIDYALAAFGPRADSLPGARDSLVRLASILPTGPLDSVHVIGANRFTSPTVDESSLTYEYHSMQGWGVVAIAIVGPPNARLIQAIRANRLTESLEQSNAFTLRGKSAGHCLMLLMLMVCLGSAVWVAALALRTKMKRRWAWALLALLGAGTVMFNWTTGQVGFVLLKFLLLDAALGRTAPAGPWVLQAAFPVGAIMTWRRVQQARGPAPAPIAPAPTETATESASAIHDTPATSL